MRREREREEGCEWVERERERDVNGASERERGVSGERWSEC